MKFTGEETKSLLHFAQCTVFFFAGWQIGRSNKITVIYPKYSGRVADIAIEVTPTPNRYTSATVRLKTDSQEITGQIEVIK